MDSICIQDHTIIQSSRAPTLQGRVSIESDARQSVSNSQSLCHVLFEQQLLDWITGSNTGVGSSKTTTMFHFLARPLPLGAASSSSAFLFPPAALPTFKQNRSYCLCVCSLPPQSQNMRVMEVAPQAYKNMPTVKLLVCVQTPKTCLMDA